MAVAHDYRIPHSEFLRWDEDDRAKALWWYVRQLSLCPLCGLPPEDHTDPAKYIVRSEDCWWARMLQQKTSDKDPMWRRHYLIPREVVNGGKRRTA